MLLIKPELTWAHQVDGTPKEESEVTNTLHLQLTVP